VFIVGVRVDGDPRAAAERAGQVLAVGTRCPGHPAARGETRSDAPVASLSGLGTGGPDDNDGQGGRLISDGDEPTAVSLFSGVGGLDLGLHRAGFRHLLMCESDSYRRDVLAARWPGVSIYHDVRALGLDAVSDAREGRNGEPTVRSHPRPG